MTTVTNIIAITIIIRIIVIELILRMIINNYNNNKFKFIHNDNWDNNDNNNKKSNFNSY